MEFTPQQRMGYKGFNPKTRLGNWSEDIDLEETLLKDFLHRKEQGMLTSSIGKSRRAHHLQPVDVTQLHEDGFVHAGDRVLLHCENVDAYLSMDLNDHPPTDSEAAEVTCAPAERPVARNVFEIERFVDEKSSRVMRVPAGEEDILHYGEPFMITSSTEMGPKHYLHSEQQSVTSFSRATRHQEVCMKPAPSFDCVWIAVHPDPNMRLEAEGLPIQANTVVLLSHAYTRSYLSGESMHHGNEYGKEYEVCACIHRNLHKVETKEHWWTIVSAPSEGAEEVVEEMEE